MTSETRGLTLTSRQMGNMLYNARARAAKAEVPFTISPADIFVPTKCPILGIPIECGKGRGGHLPGSPSLDRVVPQMGYVPGNVMVISNRANSIKRDATLDELRKLVEFLEHHIANRWMRHEEN